MTPQASYFIPGSLEDTKEYIEVSDGHHIMAKQNRQVQIKVCNNNGETFIATLHNVSLEQDIWDRLCSIIQSINLGHTWLFHKEFCMVWCDDKEKNAVTLTHSA